MNSLAVPVWRRVSIEVYCPVEFGRFNHDTAETPMTRTSMDLSGFLAKHDQSDFMHVPAGNVLHLIMEADVEGLIGAGRHERADNRTTWRTTRRNGYRESALDTRMGTLNLKVPKLRHGRDFPGFPEPRKISGKALVSLVQEAWISGVSTRKMDDPVQAMGIAGMSRSTVSRLCKDIDERVHGFLNRPLTGEWPYLWLDATCLRARQGGRIVPVAAIVAVAANKAPRRRRGDLPQRGLHHPPHRYCALRTERRMADSRKIHAGRGIRTDQSGGDRPHSQHLNKNRMIMTAGHQIYNTLTDVTLHFR